MHIKKLLNEEENTINEELINKAQPRVEEYSVKRSDNIEERKK